MDPAKREIRLAHVAPSNDIEAQACVSLKIVSLDTEPVYEAVSYCWGDANVKRPITLEGCRWEVTTNLEAGLRHLRDTADVKILWIDAICINQADLDEKSVQILLMKNIYADAQLVRIWLGEATDGNDEAFDRLQRLHRGDDVDGGFLRQDLDSLTEIFSRPWWRRVWVIQEFVLARAAIVHCGKASLSIDAFMGGLRDGETLFRRLLGNITSQSESKPHQFNESDFAKALFLENSLGPFRTIRALHDHEDRQNISGKAFLYVLMFAGLFDASDARDKIYGVLGLAPDFRVAQITPNYNDALSLVYMDATFKMIKNYGSLVLLGLAEFWRAEDSITPTWVPDWTAKRSDGVSAFLIRRVLLSLKSRACGHQAISAELLGNSTLKLRGVLFDRVRETSLACSGPSEAVVGASQLPNAMESNIHERLRKVAGVDAWRRCHRSYIAGGMREDAYWRSLEHEIAIATSEGECHFKREDIRKRRGRNEIAKRQKLHDLGLNIWNPAGLYDGSGRPLIATDKGYIGIGPTRSKPGDTIYILAGGRCPVVLRPLPSASRRNTFQLVGMAYIDGIMDGEAVLGHSSTLKETIQNWSRHMIFGGRSPDKDLPLTTFEDVYIE